MTNLTSVEFIFLHLSLPCLQASVPSVRTDCIRMYKRFAALLHRMGTISPYDRCIDRSNGEQIGFFIRPASASRYAHDGVELLARRERTPDLLRGLLSEIPDGAAIRRNANLSSSARVATDDASIIILIGFQMRQIDMSLSIKKTGDRRAIVCRYLLYENKKNKKS